MMYNNKLVAVIKVNGNVLREDKEVVHIPFGSEYTIQLKNLHTRKAVVSITIDGDDVCDDSQYVINPKQTVEIEGFLRGNKIANKFKFIEKTQEISDFRGDNMEDGLIRIDYQFEAETPFWCNSGYRSIIDPGNIKYGSKSGCSDLIGSSGDQTIYNSQTQQYSSNLNGMVATYCCSCNTSTSNDVWKSIQESDQGITARGSESDQTFRHATVGTLESTVHTIVFQLRGMSNGQMLKHALTVNRKIQCENCGRKWKSSFNSCGNCGTSLR